MPFLSSPYSLHKGNIITNVVGMRFIEWAKYLSIDEYLNDKMVELVREPDNQHDENAIAIETEGFRQTWLRKNVLLQRHLRPL